MSFDFSEFEALREQYAQVEQQIPAFLEQFLLEEGESVLDLTKSNTPVDTGRLKGNWFISNVKRHGDTLEIELYNNIEYASFVEDGHQTRSESFVKGKHMARRAISEIERNMPKHLLAEFQKYIESLEGK